MSIRSIPFLLLVSAAFLSAGCDTEPSPTGLDGLPGGDLVGLVSFNTDSTGSAPRTSTYFTATPGATSPYLALGSGNGYESRVLLRWISFPSSIGDSGTLHSASITLHVAPHTIGSAAAPLAFSAKDLRAPWSSYTATSDSLQKLVTGGIVGSYSGVLPDSITFEIDTALARSWLRLSRDKRAGEIYGVLLEAAPGSQALRSFFASEHDPIDKIGVPSLKMRMTLGGKDTTIVASTLEDTYIATGPAQPAGGLFLHGGLSYRGRVAFDVSGVPAGSIVNNVELLLTADPATSRRMFRAIDTIIVYQMLDSTKNELGVNAVYTTKKDTSGVFRAQGLALVKAVQQWVNNPASNHGFALVKTAEVSDIDLLSFHAADAPPGKRPSLRITYTRKP